MVAGFAGSVLGGLDMGDTSTMAATTPWALLYTALAAVLGLGVGMVVRHSAGAISGLLVWWFVLENLLLAFAPARAARFLPFDAGFRLLEMDSDLDSPEILAAALTRPQYALVFGAYTALSLIAGMVLLSRRDN
jgi:ABC-2 type transport system permease protein